MGSDKALLPIGRANLLRITLDRARSVVPAPVIVGSRERYSDYGEVIEDIFPGCGPLGGIHAALETTRTDVSLIMSVDTPLMTAEFMRWLLTLAAAGNELAIVPEADGRLQPLCAAYRRAALGEVDAALRRGEFKVDRVFARLPTRFIPDSEWLAAGFAAEIFRNVNTPEEYHAMCGMLAETLPSSRQGPQS